jgi:hypothetical protein
MYKYAVIGDCNPEKTVSQVFLQNFVGFFYETLKRYIYVTNLKNTGGKAPEDLKPRPEAGNPGVWQGGSYPPKACRRGR